MSTDEAITGPQLRRFDDFYAAEYLPLVRYVVAFTSDFAVAEDLAAEAFAAAWRCWDQLSDSAHPDRWLRKVLRHKHTDLLRRKYSRERALARLGHDPAPASMPADDDDELRAAVAKLPTRQAQVIALMYYEDRPADQIADILGIKVDDVYKHHNRAKTRLRALLDEAP